MRQQGKEGEQKAPGKAIFPGMYPKSTGIPQGWADVCAPRLVWYRTGRCSVQELSAVVLPSHTAEQHGHDHNGWTSGSPESHLQPKRCTQGHTNCANAISGEVAFCNQDSLFESMCSPGGRVWGSSQADVSVSVLQQGGCSLEHPAGRKCTAGSGCPPWTHLQSTKGKDSERELLSQAR